MDISKLKQQIIKRRGLLPGLMVFTLCAVAGNFLIQSGGAATYAADSEAESGVIAAPAVAVDDAGASDGRSVRFQAAPAPPPPPPPPSPPVGGSGFSLRFFGTQTNDIDRVKIPLTPNKSVDVGGNFTLEWWMKTAAGNDLNPECIDGGDVSWIYGNIIWDRDVDGPGDTGDYGISVFGDGRLAFGVQNGNGTRTICSSTSVNDGQWHHVAATRNTTSGQMCLYIDGTQRGCATGPTGDIGYRDGRGTGQPSSDPFLVIGAEKHDYWTAGQGYHGWVDEARLSNTVRYTASFSRPGTAFAADAATVALYHFDSGSGTVLVDETGANSGTIRVGGANNGPQWSNDRPF